MTDAPVSGPDLPSMPTLHAHPDEKIITTWGVLRKYMNDATALQSDNARLIAENEGLRRCLTKSDMMRHDLPLEIATLHARIETLRGALKEIELGFLGDCPSAMEPIDAAKTHILGLRKIAYRALAQSAKIEGRE